MKNKEDSHFTFNASKKDMTYASTGNKNWLLEHLTMIHTLIIFSYVLLISKFGIYLEILDGIDIFFTKAALYSGIRYSNNSQE